MAETVTSEPLPERERRRLAFRAYFGFALEWSINGLSADWSLLKIAIPGYHWERTEPVTPRACPEKGLTLAGPPKGTNPFSSRL